MKININDKIKVKLTDYGKYIHKQNFYMHKRNFGGFDIEYIPPQENLEGYSTFQMWDLMRIFGPYVFHGCELPFETNIKIDIGLENVKINRSIAKLEEVLDANILVGFLKEDEKERLKYCLYTLKEIKDIFDE